MTWPRRLSRCYTLTLLAETCVKRRGKRVSEGVAPCNIEGRNWFVNVEGDVEVLFPWP